VERVLENRDEAIAEHEEYIHQDEGNCVGKVIDADGILHFLDRVENRMNENDEFRHTLLVVRAADNDADAS